MIWRTLSAALVFAATACGPPAARFTGTDLAVGDFDMVPDRCWWTSEPSEEGVVLRGLEFVEERQPGLMVLVVNAATGPSILTSEHDGLVVVWRIGGHGRHPQVRIPASDCRVFELTANLTEGGSTRANIELDCSTPDGGRLVGRASFWESC